MLRKYNGLEFQESQFKLQSQVPSSEEDWTDYCVTFPAWSGEFTSISLGDVIVLTDPV